MLSSRKQIQGKMLYFTVVKTYWIFLLIDGTESISISWKNLQECYVRKNDKLYLPQNGIPCGTQVPFVPHILLAGPNNSNPLSHVYRATVPGSTVGVLNSTVEWAGAPGNPHFSAKIKGKKNLSYN